MSLNFLPRKLICVVIEGSSDVPGALLGTAIAYFSTVCLPKMRQGRSAVHTDRTSNRMCLNDPNGVMAEKVSMHTIAEDDLT